MNFGCQSFVAGFTVKQQKSRTTMKQSIVSVAATMSVDLLLTEISMGHQTFFVTYQDGSEGEATRTILSSQTTLCFEQKNMP
jgi:hypothetical protein